MHLNSCVASRMRPKPITYRYFRPRHAVGCHVLLIDTTVVLRLIDPCVEPFSHSIMAVLINTAVSGKGSSKVDCMNR